jgi:L-ascorbate metabolism protein UlaG (beta-lactamase superfamily)
MMQKTHMNPAQAIQAAVLLRAGTMVPVHFETFVSSLDGPTEDRDKLLKAELSSPDSLKIVNWSIGQSTVVSEK